MRYFSLLLLLVFVVGCSPLSKRLMTKTMRHEEEKFHHHAGLYVKDLRSGKVLFEYNSRQYFTPASNTKILTLFTALNVLGERVPGLRYEERNDSLIFWGTGDPSFLYDLTFNDSSVFQFLKASGKNLYFSTANYHTTAFGPGWAWDDYNDEYSAERSPMPIYGNCFQVLPLPDQLRVVPTFFQRYLEYGEPGKKAQVIRDVTSNTFRFHPGMDGKYRDFRVPFRTTQALVAQILSDTLHRRIGLSTSRLSKGAKTIYSIPADSLYSVMMKESDNHIAEQLLLMSAMVLSDSLKPEIAIRHMQDKFFKSYSDKPIWRDGSGLSRYNLVTPRFIGELWQDIYRKVPERRLFSLLATGGERGTLKNWYNGGNTPYLFGKTGSLSNNHCLSGYLVTKKGKVLIFAFMNSNYATSITDIRRSMQKILNLYYDNY